MNAMLRALLAIGLMTLCCSAGATLLQGRAPLRSVPVELDVFPQNFAIAVDDRSRIYLGGDGVLIFDGAYWQQVALGNDDIVRSLAAGEDGRVYVGGYDAFGYIEQLPTGEFQYTELSGLYRDELAGEAFADIWRMAVTPQAVFFVGLEHLFRYEPESGRTEFWFHDGSLGPIAAFDGRVLLQFRGEGIKEYRDSGWTLIESPDLSRIYLEAMVEVGGELLLISSDSSWYRFDGTHFETLPESRSVPFVGSVTYAITTQENEIALTTSVGKVIFLDLSDWSAELVDVSRGFIGGAARTRSGELLFVDDTGFHAISWPSPWRVVDQGLSGTVHYFGVVDNVAYALTSAGVFARRPGAAAFERLDWTDYEAWALLPLESGDLLFADSYEITLRSADGEVRLIDESTTAREFLRSARDPDVVWVGTELGLQVLRRDGESWTTVYRNDDLDNLRITDIIETDDNEIWVGSERGGIRRMSFRRGAQWQMSERKFGPEDGLYYGQTDPQAQLVRIGGALHVSTAEGVFRWQDGRFAETALGELDALLPPNRFANIAAQGDTRWAFTYSELFRHDGAWRKLDVSSLAPGALNRLHFIDGKVVFGTLGALLVFDPEAEGESSSQAPLNLSSAVVFRREADPNGSALPLDNITLTGDDDRLTLRYVLADLKNPQSVQYRTRLLPLEESFSPFSRDNQQSFVAMNPGEYVFQVQARDSAGRVASMSVPISVTPSWLELPVVRALAALLLLVAAASVSALVTRSRSSRLRRERDRLERMIRERTQELASANQKLELIAHRDSLTQLPNRRRVDDYLHDVWRQCSERGRSLAIALIDVDHFKQYNDSFGHRAGDDLLVALAQQLSRHLRRSEDLVARYGGEEFLAVFPGADLETAAEIMESMRRGVAESDLNVTLSCGVHALTPAAGLSVEEMIAATDTALYQAKHDGRDRVVSAASTD